MPHQYEHNRDEINFNEKELMQNYGPNNAIDENEYYVRNGWYRQMNDDGDYQWYRPYEDRSQEDFNREISLNTQALLLK